MLKRLELVEKIEEEALVKRISGKCGGKQGKRRQRDEVKELLMGVG